MQPKTAKRVLLSAVLIARCPRRRIDIATEAIDYKNPDLLKKFGPRAERFCRAASPVMPRTCIARSARDQTQAVLCC